jgi:hypothetical protein
MENLIVFCDPVRRTLQEVFSFSFVVCFFTGIREEDKKFPLAKVTGWHKRRQEDSVRLGYLFINYTVGLEDKNISLEKSTRIDV